MARKKTSSPGYDPVLFQMFESVPRKGDLKKVEILDAALQIIANEGIEAVSNESIGKRLKIRRSHVAYYFKSKEDIVEMAIKFIAAKAQSLTAEMVSENMAPDSKLLSIVDAAFEFAIHYPAHISVLLLFYYYCTYNEKYRTLMASIRQSGRERIQTLLGLLYEERGTKISAPDLVHRSRLIQAIIFGTLFEYFGTHPKGDNAALKELKRRTSRDISHLIG